LSIERFGTVKNVAVQHSVSSKNKESTPSVYKKSKKCLTIRSI